MFVDGDSRRFGVRNACKIAVYDNSNHCLSSFYSWLNDLSRSRPPSTWCES